jgi:hypothetical protein
MSHERKRHLVAAVALGALFALPLAAAPAGAAEPANVTFTGGLGSSQCGSRPDTPTITVAAEQKARLTNQLGLKATLNIDGAASASVDSGEAVEVQFHRGPVSITMIPDCPPNLDPSFEELTVQVTPATKPGPAPARSTTPRSSTRPSTHATGHARPQDGSPAVPALPADPLFPEVTDLPAGGSLATDANLELPATVVRPSGSPQGQRLAGGTGPTDKGSIGLLAIIATVCIIGVSVGAIRAIITQRATRVEFV